MLTATQSLDIVVIGAGQAGLAVGYYLKKTGLTFRLLDAATRVGESWRERYDSLKLFTPAEYDNLPGLKFPAPKGTYPTKDLVAGYLEAYARQFSLPVQLRTKVTSLKREGGTFRLRTNRGSIQAAQVVVATGPFQTPFTPAVSQQLDGGVVQLHSSAYRNETQLPSGDVLVVGAGNSGLQIAEELLASRPVTLAQGKPQPFLPQRVAGRSIFWWLERLRLSRVPATSWLGQQLKQRDPVIGTNTAELKRKGLRVTSRVVGASGQTVTLADGHTLKPSSIIWATGFRPDYDWIHLPVTDAGGHPIHQQGTTSVDGLYFLGLSWQRTRGSALLGWVGQDAAYIAERIARKSSPALFSSPLPGADFARSGEVRIRGKR